LRQFVTRLGEAPVPAAAPAAQAGTAAPDRAPSAPAGPASPQAAGQESREVPGETRVFPVPPPKADPSSAVLVPLAGTLATGILLGWLLGRRSRRS
jgi:hypothetical protein